MPDCKFNTISGLQPGACRECHRIDHLMVGRLGSDTIGFVMPCTYELVTGTCTKGISCRCIIRHLQRQDQYEEHTFAPKPLVLSCNTGPPSQVSSRECPTSPRSPDLPLQSQECSSACSGSLHDTGAVM